MVKRHHLDIFKPILMPLCILGLCLSVQGGDKIIVVPSIKPTFIISPLERTHHASRLNQLVAELEKSPEAEGVGQAVAGNVPQFIDPVLPPSLQDKLKKRQELKENWILATEEDYQEVEDEKESKLFKDENDSEDLVGVESEDSYLSKDDDDSLLAKYMTDDDQNSRLTKGDKKKSKFNSDEDENLDPNNEDNLNLEEDLDAAVDTETARLDDPTLEPDSEWDRLLNQNTRLRNGILGDSKGLSVNSSSILFSSGENSQSSGVQPSSILSGKIRNGLQNSISRKSITHSLGIKDPINNALDQSNQLRGPSSVQYENNLVSEPVAPIQNIGISSNGSGLELNTSSPSILGQTNPSFGQPRQQSAPQIYKKPTVLKFPKRPF